MLKIKCLKPPAENLVLIEICKFRQTIEEACVLPKEFLGIDDGKSAARSLCKICGKSSKE